MAAFAQEAAVLLMDDCSAHVSNVVLRILTEARVRVISFAPHTIQVSAFSLVFSSGARGMNCHSMTIIRRYNA
jgi:hypothetical protein